MDKQAVRAIIDAIFKIGALAGLAGIFYQIHNNRKHRPSFSFTFESSHAEFSKRDKLKVCEYHFSGILRNISLSPNTIVRLYLTVWENKKRGSVLRFGHTVEEVKDINTDDLVYLPLRFDSKQAFRLEIVFEFPLTGTRDEKLITSLKKWGDSGLLLPKYRYEFFIEDVSGNLFDYRSSILSREIIDLWWTLPNFSKRPLRYLFELIKIIFVFIKWKLSKFSSAIGFYK